MPFVGYVIPTHPPCPQHPPYHEEKKERPGKGERGSDRQVKLYVPVHMAVLQQQQQQQPQPQPQPQTPSPTT
ncbi:hypothetical protein BP00DRAFT_430886 [Aspergillus indologenus CBS 114.80]|uniref:Uncharacterized protein n=1 Tax=Aspergillus indologenus CBS 114.80 TaxID=1450541 RepID=A0A2V5HW71_9EURO|nr:hypothetical protein BP00DRAFT_430886 [Aspergillus indologenus CBS 114.80]